MTTEPLDLNVCPDKACGMVAEVVDVHEFDSTAGPVTMRRTLCLHGHIYDGYIYTPGE